MSTLPIREPWLRKILYPGVFGETQLPRQTGPYEPTGPSIDSMNVPYGVSPPPTPPPPMEMESPGLSNEANTRFLDLLDQFPRRREPSTLRRIGASLAAIGDRETGEKILYPGYDREMQDWKEQANVYGQAASLERMNNSTISQDEYRKLTDRFRIDAERQRNEDRDEDRKIRQQNADTGRFRAENQARAQSAALDKTTKVITDRAGNMWALNGRNEISELPIESLSFEDKLRLQQEGRLTIVDDQQEAQKELARLRHEQELKEIERRAELKTDTSTQSESDKRKGVLRRAEEFIRNNPGLKDWVIIEGDKVDIKAPFTIPVLGRDTSRDNETLEMIRKYIDPDYKGPASSTEGTIKPSSTTTPKPAAAKPATTSKAATPPKKDNMVIPPKGKLRVADKDGNEFWLPIEQWPTAEKRGYRKVVGK